MDRKNGPGGLGNPPKNSPDYNNSKANQRSRMLKAFKEYPKRSTFAFRNLGIVSPASRIMELRDRQHDIVTEWTDEPDQNGVIHQIALYVYLGYKNDREGN